MYQLVESETPMPDAKAPSTLYCHNCKTWGPWELDYGYYSCVECGDDIICDECGQDWTPAHRHNNQGPTR